jgi:photosystem II stability/assembly factor-like uncharacterized protein
LPLAAGVNLWEAIGPSNIGGRATSVVAHPADPNRIWLGAAGGGVWHSPDGGSSWQTAWSDQDVLNIGSLAIDPGNPDVIYCGTGEANLSADSYGGVGLYRSSDAGATWQLLASCDRDGVPRRIGAIAIDPQDSQHLLLGGIGLNEVSQQADLGGLYTSRDGGLTWTRETFVSQNNYWCHAVRFDPANSQIVYATFTAQGQKSGIYKSLDGGRTWVQLRTGLPAPEAFGRTSLAVSPSNSKVLYAMAADERSAHADSILGVFRSADAGNTWTEIGGQHFAGEGQMSYGNSVAIDPADPNHVLCGCVDLHLTRDGGQTWTRASQWDAPRGTPAYAHADHHAILMPVGAAGLVYDANDGGMDRSVDGGNTWANRSNGLSITMFYDMDVAQSDSQVIGGGAQDNGTLVTLNGQPDEYSEILGGDGGWIVFDPGDALHLFASYYNLNIFRFHQGVWKNVSPPAPDAEKKAVWMAFLELHPTAATTVYAGSNRMWITEDDGDNWKPLSSVLDGSSISAIEIARSDPRNIYVGTENGGIFRSTDGGGSWSANISGPELPGHAITRLAASPANPARVYATVANFGHSHVFRSDDGGSSWIDSDRGQLPDVPHHSIAIPADRPDTIYVCSDAGVFVSEDAGLTWSNLSRNLPRVMVIDLVWQAHDQTLHAATYGRGLFRLNAREN